MVVGGLQQRVVRVRRAVLYAVGVRRDHNARDVVVLLVKPVLGAVLVPGDEDHVPSCMSSIRFGLMKVNFTEMSGVDPSGTS